MRRSNKGVAGRWWEQSACLQGMLVGVHSFMTGSGHIGLGWQGGSSLGITGPPQGHSSGCGGCEEYSGRGHKLRGGTSRPLVRCQHSPECVALPPSVVNAVQC